MFKTEAKLAAYCDQAPRRFQSGENDKELKRNSYNPHLAHIIHIEEKHALKWSFLNDA
jgi:hypothetical protein